MNDKFTNFMMDYELNDGIDFNNNVIIVLNDRRTEFEMMFGS